MQIFKYIFIQNGLKYIECISLTNKEDTRRMLLEFSPILLSKQSNT